MCYVWYSACSVDSLLHVLYKAIFWSNETTPNYIKGDVHAWPINLNILLCMIKLKMYQPPPPSKKMQNNNNKLYVLASITSYSFRGKLSRSVY